MKKIPFNIKYRPEIEAGKYKVVTEHGEPVEIVKWDCKGVCSILAVIDDGDTEESCFFDADGTSILSKEKLHILTDEPELTEFEEAVEAIYESCGVKELQFREKAAELLAIAQKEIEKSQWIKDMQEWWYNKGHLEGYAKGQEDAEKRFREHQPVMYYYNPPCFVGGPCTNPHHDCINCPRTGISGIAKTDTNIK